MLSAARLRDSGQRAYCLLCRVVVFPLEGGLLSFIFGVCVFRAYCLQFTLRCVHVAGLMATFPPQRLRTFLCCPREMCLFPADCPLTGVQPEGVRAIEVMLATILVTCSLAFGSTWIQIGDGNVPLQAPSVSVSNLFSLSSFSFHGAIFLHDCHVGEDVCADFCCWACSSCTCAHPGQEFFIQA